VARLEELLPERLDAVVNNAGIGVGGPIQTVSLDDVRRQLEVNVVGQIAVTQATLPKLRRSRGRLVFISSLNGRVSIPLSGVYNSSKFALEALADSLRVELRPWGVRVILVEPGCIDTDPWREMMSLLDGVAADMSPRRARVVRPASGRSASSPGEVAGTDAPARDRRGGRRTGADSAQPAQPHGRRE
jgi:NAD(P)-dependent dehydrogenase (short-subunit alcohol dehydrogenase family)